MSPTDYTSIANTAITVLPAILALVRNFHATVNPGAPPLTDADVIQALHDLVAREVLKDEQWKAAHPPENDEKPSTTATPNTPGD